VTALALGEALDLKSYRTAWAWMQKIRGLMAAANVPAYKPPPRETAAGNKVLGRKVSCWSLGELKDGKDRGRRFYRVLKQATKAISV
jgi:hypothetical protein